MMGSSKVYVSELESSSTTLEDLNAQFRCICGQWKLISLYETLPTKLMSGVKKLVSISVSSRLAVLLRKSRSLEKILGSWATLKR